MRVAAVDLGATSGRVCVATFRADGRDLEVVHRFAHHPVEVAGTLRWDWTRLVDEVRRGLAIARDTGPLVSIGVDTWGVDYGLLDGGGDLLSPPYSYRDSRTSGWRAVAARLGEERLYATTGIQLMAINTVFQLAAHDPEELARARSLLMLPELVVHSLTGEQRGERSSAGTTGLVDATTGDWARGIVEDIGVDPSILPTIGSAGHAAGSWEGVPVVLVGGHDTASAVLATPGAQEGRVFISSGSWLLVGVERDEADVSDAARAANFSNEPGVYGGVRFLKNVAGLVLLERCRARWDDPPIDTLLDAARRSEVTVLIDPDAAVEAPDVIAHVCGETGLPSDARGDIVRVIVRSLAARTAAVVEELRGFADAPLCEIAMVGGGVRNELLCDEIAALTGLPVRRGPAEATAWGNALAQAAASEQGP